MDEHAQKPAARPGKSRRFTLASVLSTPTALLLLIVLSVFLRLIFIPNPGFEADVSFWKSWGLAPLDKGVVWSMHNTNNNYPTPFAYFLMLLVRIYSLFADPHNFEEFWNNNNVLFLAIAKTPSILADFGIAAIFVWIGKNARRLGFPQVGLRFYIGLGLLYLLSPISIMDGAWWGQVDSIGVIVFLCAILAVLTKRPFLAGLIYITAMMTKLQNMIFGPLFFVFVWQMLGTRGFVRAVAGAMLGFLGLNIEFFLAKDMGRVFQSLTDNYDYFPLMSLNAYNLWWIVAGANGMKMTDKILVLGVMNAKQVGLVFFAGLYLLGMLHLLSTTIADMWNASVSWSKKALQRQQKLLQEQAERIDLQGNPVVFQLFTALTIVVCAFFLFQTQSHERYAFPLTVFLLMMAPFLPARRRKAWLIGYGIYTVVYFYNLHTAFADNYPQNVLPVLRDFSQPGLTIAVSFLQLGLFGALLVFLFPHIRKAVYGVSAGFIVFMLYSGNSAYLRSQPIPVSKLTPHTSLQDYGRRGNNRSTNGAYGPKSWTRLSTQYFFYKRGLGTHSHSKIVYHINGLFSTLTTDYGIDTEAGAPGSAAFQVWGDGKLLFGSETRGRFDQPQHVSVDIRGVQQLELVTTDGGNGINDDHADWLNPQLHR